jgi:SWI/SNF-related matrix-associated actin-dependent regulator 1 of chromatin subfamily A
MIGLTGTLLLNNPLDAYVPLKWIGVDKATYTNFRFYYCNYAGLFNNILVGYKNLDVLKEELASCSLRRTKDLLDLPPKNIIHESVELDPRQSAFYTHLLEGITEEADKVDLNTSAILSMVTRLRQATACPNVLTSDEIESSKVNRAIDLAKQIIEGGDKVVIFSVFKETLNSIMKELKEFGPLLCTGDVKEDIIAKNIEAFQTNDVNKVICATTAKMGTGITLTRASYAIFIDAPWTAAQCTQCEDRIYRIGSKNPVFIYYLWARDTIDERVKEIIEDKEAIADFIVDNKISNKSMDSLKKYILDL